MDKISASWEKGFAIASTNSAAALPHLRGISLSQVDEIVNVVTTWLARTRAPTGFAPGFHLAKSVAQASLPGVLGAAQQVEAGQYNHFPSFIAGLLNVLNAIHTMAIYSQKGSDEPTALADFTAELAQALSLLRTAQAELAAKVERLESVADLANTIEAIHTEASQLKVDIESNFTAIELDKTAATEAVTEARSFAAEIEQLRTEAAQAVAESERIHQKLNSVALEAENVKGKCEEHEKLIASVIPRGASAGLAAAFASRVGQLNSTKFGWMLTFITAVLILAAFAYHLSTLEPPKDAYLSFILYRMSLAAPFIWLAWFSAIQYGNTVRVQEDYAFKEATSKAFQGYRDHMDHLASINDDEAESAMRLMAQRTIEILAREPLRIFGRTDHDASPASAATNIIDRFRKVAQDKQS